MECRAALAEVPSDFRCATEKYGMAASASPPSISFREFTVSSFVQGGSTLKKTAIQFDTFRHKRLKRGAIEGDSNVNVLHNCSPQSNPRFKTISLAEPKIGGDSRCRVKPQRFSPNPPLDSNTQAASS